MNSMMACQPSRIQLQTRIHSWQNQHHSGCIVQTCKCWPRPRRQQKHHHSSPSANMCHPHYPKRTDNCLKCKRTRKSHSKQSTWCPHSQTPRMRQNPPMSSAKLLVGWHEEMDQRLCQRMCYMPIDQGQHTQATHTHIPHPNHYRHTTI